MGRKVAFGIAMILAGILGTAGAWEAPPRQLTFYVAPSGNDAWSGKQAEPHATKTDGPFATLLRARDAVRRAGPEHARKVIVRRGTYYLRETLALEKEDSGTQNAPVVWQAALGEEVRLVGGRAIPPEAFGPVSDSSAIERLDPAGRGKVLQVDLAGLRISLPGPFPARFRGPSPAPELFFNDQRMMLARWPNDGWTTIAKIIDSGSYPRDGDNASRPGVFEYAGDRPSRWNVESGVWLQGYWCFDWSEEVKHPCLHECRTANSGNE